MRTQVLQPLALGNGQVTGYDQDAGVPRCGTADGQRRAEAAGAGLHHRHAGLQRAGWVEPIRPLDGPVLRGIAVQPHDGAAVDVLIIAVQDGHSGAPHFP